MVTSSDIGKMVIAVVLFTSIVGGLSGWAISRYVIYRDSIDRVSSEESYYRGIYDICHSAMSISSPECLVMVEKAVSMNWFDDGSDGWVWDNEH